MGGGCGACDTCGYGCGWEQIPNGGGTYLCCVHDPDDHREVCRDLERNKVLDAARVQTTPPTTSRNVKGHSMGFETPSIDSTTTNALLFGPSGSGKTTGAGTACSPGTVDLAVLNTEGGGWQSIAHGLGYTPLVWDIRCKADIVQAWQELHDGKHPQVKTVVVDSTTDLAKVIMDDILATRSRRRPAPDVPCMEDYNEASQIMSKMLRRFRDLPLNVIFVALEKDKIEVGEANGKEIRRVVGTVPDLPGKLAEQLPALVDVSIYCAAVEVEKSDEHPTGIRYLGQTVPSKGRTCKVRGGVLPPFIDLHWTTIAAAYGREEGLLAGTVPVATAPIAAEPDASQEAADAGETDASNSTAGSEDEASTRDTSSPAESPEATDAKPKRKAQPKPPSVQLAEAADEGEAAKAAADEEATVPA